MPRYNSGYEDVKIKVIDVLNANTGEIKAEATASYNPDTHRIIKINDKKKAPKKAEEPFTMITKIAAGILTFEEKSLFYAMTELIDWEDNFIRDIQGNYLTIAGLTELVSHNRNTVRRLLLSLQDKKFIQIVEVSKREKYIYLYSRYVWFGFEDKRNDSKLNQVLASLKEASHNNTNKENGSLEHSNHNRLISTVSVSDLYSTSQENKSDEQDDEQRSIHDASEAIDDNNTNKQSDGLTHYNQDRLISTVSVSDLYSTSQDYTKVNENGTKNVPIETVSTHYKQNRLVITAPVNDNVLTESEKHMLTVKANELAAAGKYDEADGWIQMTGDIKLIKRYNSWFMRKVKLA